MTVTTLLVLQAQVENANADSEPALAAWPSDESVAALVTVTVDTVTRAVTPVTVSDYRRAGGPVLPSRVRVRVRQAHRH